MIDKTFNNTNGLFLISFKSGDDNPTRNSFDKNYIPLVKITNSPFFNQPGRYKMCIKNVLKCREKMTIRQKIC